MSRMNEVTDKQYRDSRERVENQKSNANNDTSKYFHTEYIIPKSIDILKKKEQRESRENGGTIGQTSKTRPSESIQKLNQNLNYIQYGHKEENIVRLLTRVGSTDYKTENA